MPLGFDRDLNVINTNDSAELHAYVNDEFDVPIPEVQLAAVNFKIQRPDGTDAEEAGVIDGDGHGFLRYLDTDLVGEYKVAATFTFVSGQIKSSRADFEVIDPFDPPELTDEEIIAHLVWRRLEDLFDSEEGGPWLQDVTMATFKKEKIKTFIAEGLFEINQAHPPTDIGLEGFVLEGTPNADSPLLVHGVLLSVIRHLIRSYTEQPTPTGGQVVYEDRRDYLQRWQSVLQTEEQRYARYLALWKRQYLRGGPKMILGAKAGRLTPAPMRTRNVGRGYY
jgi:hypothetical protein